MFSKYKIDIDSDRFFKDLDLAKKDMNKIARRMMARVSQAIKKDVKDKNLKGGLLKKREGLLLKSLKYKTKADFTATIASNTAYSSVHEKGMTILPKNGKYLAFQINGEWKRAKQIEVPQRQFLWPVIDQYFTSNKAEKLMDETLQSALDELFKE